MTEYQPPAAAHGIAPDAAHGDPYATAHAVAYDAVVLAGGAARRLGGADKP
ncbi:molybdenum cofactor guanylyltransferase, partial [Streptomyces sp. SID4956]|nr:molybdenum cofactor guanylyltransferase [Streptomyces sp. SID4956]